MPIRCCRSDEYIAAPARGVSQVARIGRSSLCASYRLGLRPLRLARCCRCVLVQSSQPATSHGGSRASVVGLLLAGCRLCLPRIGRMLAVREIPPLPASASARSLLSLRSRATASARGVSRRFAGTGRRLASGGLPPLPAATLTRSLLSLRSARNRPSPRRLTDHPHLNPCAVVVVLKALPFRPVASHSTSRSGRCQHQLAAAAARGRDYSLAVVVMYAHYRLGQ